ncbi:MAG: glycosyl transferase [Oscillospiraceae bacterium]|nr:glycosyl transferase [Oscillospiraceae bacterium]
MIPKTIHYCWFGKGEKPKLVQKCIQSWKRVLPDYEIVEWNETNFDIGANEFVRQAYENRNYAFVSDYARAKALFDNGGVYLDTDVEVLKSFDAFLGHRMFAGFEEENFVGTCVMGAEKGFPLLIKYMEHYEGTPYVLPDGSFYKSTNVVLLTEMLEENGLVRDGDLREAGGVTVYPRTFFSPYDYINGINHITQDSCAIHHFAQLWLPGRVRLKSKIKRAAAKAIGGERVKRLRSLIDRETS